MAVEYATMMQPIEFSPTVARSESALGLCGPRAVPSAIDKEDRVESGLQTEVETETADAEKMVETEIVRRIEIRIAKAAETTIDSRKERRRAMPPKARPRGRASETKAKAKARRATGAEDTGV